jgi:hypothetical protein
MHRRCLELKFKDYPRYGGSGILICPQWIRNWEQFIQDMGPAPTQEHWLGRRDVTLGYTPENCIWTTHDPQMRRRQWCHKATLQGQTMTYAEATRLPGMPTWSTVRRRIKSGFSLETPKVAKLYRKSIWLAWQGETLPLPEWARRLGLPHSLLWERVKAGMPVERVMHPARYQHQDYRPRSLTSPAARSTTETRGKNDVKRNALWK